MVDRSRGAGPDSRMARLQQPAIQVMPAAARTSAAAIQPRDASATWSRTSDHCDTMRWITNPRQISATVAPMATPAATARRDRCRASRSAAASGATRPSTLTPWPAALRSPADGRSRAPFCRMGGAVKPGGTPTHPTLEPGGATCSGTAPGCPECRPLRRPGPVSALRRRRWRPGWRGCRWPPREVGRGAAVPRRGDGGAGHVDQQEDQATADGDGGPEPGRKARGRR